METIMFKAPEGTKAKLRAINPNISELLREQTAKLLSNESSLRSAHDKAQRLMFRSGRRNGATSKDYLKHYAQKSHR